MKIDDSYKINDEEAIFMANYVYKNDGIFIGGSSAVNLCAAVKACKQIGKGKTIVTILCDSGIKYTSKLFNKDILENLEVKSINEPIPIHQDVIDFSILGSKVKFFEKSQSVLN